MKYYYNYVFKEEDESSNNTVTYIGRLGEDLMFTKTSENNHIFSSLVLGLWDLTISNITKDKFIETYCNNKTRHFLATKNKHNILYAMRLSNLGEIMSKLYQEFLLSKSEECLNLINQIIKDVEDFEINKRQYIDRFITFGCEEDRDYINFILRQRKQIIRNKKYRYVIYCSFRKQINNHRGQRYEIIAKNKIEALFMFFKTNWRNVKKIDCFYKGEAIYNNLST